MNEYIKSLRIEKKNKFEWSKAVRIGQCKTCKKTARKKLEPCKFCEVNKHNLCEEHARNKKILLIFLIIVIIFLSSLFFGLICCNSIYNDSDHAKWMNDNIRQLAYINELQRQSQMTMNCANPIYGVEGSNQILINMENKPQYEITIKAGEWIFTGKDHLTGNLEQVNNEYKQRYDNHFDEKIEISIEDTNEIIYESKLVKPGYGIEHATLNSPLNYKPGIYKAIVKFTSFDKHQQIGQSNLEVDLIVEEK